MRHPRLICCATCILHFLSGSINIVDSKLQLDQSFQFSLVGDNVNGELRHLETRDNFVSRFAPHEEFTTMFENSTTQDRDFKIPGDLGEPVEMEGVPESIQADIEEGYRIYGYNKYVSDLIPLDRRLPDSRLQLCHEPNRYTLPLLPTSVVITFYNEAFSVLLRTITSILQRSPSQLLEEIVLVDDFSDLDELMEPLENAIKLIPKVRLVRLANREGLIRARLFGGLLATAPVLTFLDSHVEVAPGWLEPLMDTVTRSWKTIAVPAFAAIDPNNFGIEFTPEVYSIGSFKWDLMFAFKPISDWDKKDMRTPADSIPSPTMPGGFFSIHKDFFHHLGRYDDQLEIWGGENIELSFKAWMCGGSIKIIPCSQVAHLERNRKVYSRNASVRNAARVAAVWLDDYTQFYFDRLQTQVDFGDVSSRIALRRNLNCTSFEHYLQNVTPAMFNPKWALAYGEVKHLATSNCLDSREDRKKELTFNTNSVSLNWACHGQGGNQFWYYTRSGEIRTDEKCLDYFGESNIFLLPCHGQRGNQRFEYHADTGVVYHPQSDLCLTLDNEEVGLTMKVCEGKATQQWKFQHDKFHKALRNYFVDK